MSGEANKSLKSLICAEIVTLALAGYAKANLIDSNSIVEGGIEYYIQTNKAVYNLGENVEMLYRVTNLGNEDVTFSFPHLPEWNFWVEKDGEHIWRAVNGWYMVMTVFTLSSGESKEFPTYSPPYIWNMRDNNDNLVNVGEYYVIGGLYAGTGEYDSTRVSVHIEIVPEPAMIYYVDADANGLNDGSSWTDAYNFLQDALTAASSGDEIRVAQGIYKPDQGTRITPRDRDATFQLINGITLKGGYAGFNQLYPNAWDVELYKTILSGDLNGNDVDVNDPADLLDEPTRRDNTYHVVTGSGTDETAVLDGFTITGGNANSHWWWDGHDSGGGMYIDSGSPTVTNCTFTKNSARGAGGMLNFDISSPTLTNCTFSDNSAEDSGGAMANVRSRPTLTNCTFRDNSASYGGGGIYNWGSRPTLVNCTFRGNSATQYGGGMCNSNSNPTLTNCTFTGNSADYGGGMWNYRDSSLMLTNCTFSGNAAFSDGGAIYNYAGHLTLTNCILWGDSPEEISREWTVFVTVNHSCIQGGWFGEGNIDADPCFVGLGYWDANGIWIEGNYHLLEDSPCIDAGDPNYIAGLNETDLDGRPRVIGGRIDMGAYESPIFAEARILPRTINLASKGIWITCYIWLPDDYDVADIDPNSVFLEGEIQAESFNVDEEQQVAIAKFSRSDVQEILNAGEVALTITGRLTDGTVFEATDVIRVIDKGRGKPTK